MTALLHLIGLTLRIDIEIWPGVQRGSFIFICMVCINLCAKLSDIHFIYSINSFKGDSMRYVPVNCIRAGMIMGKKLIGRNGELFINEGIAIEESYIGKIKALGYSGVYIDDDLSRDIEIIEIINDDLRNRSAQTIKNVFTSIEHRNSTIEANINTLSDVVNSILDSVLENNDTVVNMMDLKTFDDYTYLHSVNVTLLALVIGAALELNRYDMVKLGLSAILHDIGKVFVPKTVVNKPGKLSDQEFTIMKTHSTQGYQYLKDDYDFPMASYVGVLQHHERYDGTGYPLKLAGTKIHLFGRIIAISDVYDALTSNRPYRKAMLPSEAFEYILANGNIHFDPALVTCFTRKIAVYPVGTTIQLSNGCTGIVMENYTDSFMRPKVKIFRQGVKDVTPYIVDMRNNMGYLNVTIIGQDTDSFAPDKL